MTVTDATTATRDDLEQALADYQKLQSAPNPDPLEPAEALARVSAIRNARSKSNRPAHGLSFVPPANRTGHKETDRLVDRARELASAGTAASRAVSAAERAVNTAEAQRVDLRAAADARAAGQADPPSVMPDLLAAVTTARTEDDIAQGAARRARANARDAIAVNGPAIVAVQSKVAAVSDAKARKLIEQALAELAVGAEARGVCAFVERPDRFAPADHLVPVGHGEQMTGRNVLELLAQQLGADE